MRNVLLKALLSSALFMALSGCDSSSTKNQLAAISQNTQDAIRSMATSLKGDLEKEITSDMRTHMNAEIKKQVETQLQEAMKKIIPISATTSQESSTSSTTASVPTNVVDLKKGFADIAAKASPAVVNVSTAGISEPKPQDRMGGMGGGGGMNPLEELFKEFFEMQPERPRRVQALGSGFIVRSDDTGTFVVTNNHLIVDAKQIKIILQDKTELEGFVHAADERTDLAVIKIKPESLPKEKKTFPTLNWGNSDTAQVGNFVLAIGNPFGLGNTVTSGIISGKGRDIVTTRSRSSKEALDIVNDFIQHEAPLNLGNSGGVLLNMDGDVIGVNTAIFSTNGGNIGLGFAIPATLAKQTVDQLIKFNRVKRGRLGVTVYPITKEIAESLGLGTVRGAIVMGVRPGEAAEKAGIKEKDIIIEFNGQKLDDTTRLTRIVSEAEVGKESNLKILRDNKEMTIKVTLDDSSHAENIEQADSATKEKAEQKALEVLGMKLTDIPKTLKEREGTHPLKGVMVLSVKENSSAEDSGLKKGDIINEVNTSPITTPDDLKKAVEESQKAKRNSILLTVTRRGLPPQFVVVPFKSIAESSATEPKNKDKQPEEKKETPADKK